MGGSSPNRMKNDDNQQYTLFILIALGQGSTAFS